MKSFKQNISQALWLGLPKSEAALKHTNKLKPSFKNLTEELKVTRARAVLLYRDSFNIRVFLAGIIVRTRRKWWAQSDRKSVV